MMDYTDAQITKMLVDMGLRVGRDGLPADYLDFADASLMRSGWDIGGPSKGLAELKAFWDEIGEDKTRLAAVQGDAWTDCPSTGGTAR